MDLKKEFKYVIEVNGQALQLFFRRVHVPIGNKYFVVATISQWTSTSFEVVSDLNEEWQIISPIPIGLHNLQNELKTIMDEKAIENK